MRSLSSFEFFLLTILATAATFGLVYCDGSVGHPAPPVPTPTHTPWPHSAPITQPMRIEGSRFVTQDGRCVIGLSTCCADEHDPVSYGGWPLISDARIQEAAQAGINLVHIRLGPFKCDFPFNSLQGDICPYGYHVPPGTCPGCPEWNEAFFNHVHHVIQVARDAGLYVEVDIIDGWSMKNENNAWAKKCDELIQIFPLKPYVVEWIQKVLDDYAQYPNVIFQVSNEDGVSCGYVNPQAEQYIIDEVHKRGRLVGTNSEIPSIEARADFINHHYPRAIAVLQGKPTRVNENGDLLSADDFQRELAASVALGSYFDLWRGDLDEAGYQKALQYVKAFRAKEIR